MAWNNLGGLGPNTSFPPTQYFERVGQYKSKSYTGAIDMIVRNTTEYKPYTVDWNGKNERTHFGIINVGGLHCDVAQENTVGISFEFVYPNTTGRVGPLQQELNESMWGQPANVVFVQMTYFDLDNAKDDADGGDLRECVQVNSGLNGSPSYMYGTGSQTTQLTQSVTTCNESVPNTTEYNGAGLQPRPQQQRAAVLQHLAVD